MDVHIPAQITRALRSRGVDVLTSQKDDTARYADADLLTRAGELGRLMFTMDDDFLIEAAQRYRTGESFATVIFAHMRNCSIGTCVDDLALLAEGSTADESRDQIIYLPL